ncbi:probable pectinesterase 49 [Euphorbia lathyris]|uniref:probable pectinesterase 49 n=1 Tax=Euphorbia lathyris TaxID=212925 RepID=UPI0033131437
MATHSKTSAKASIYAWRCVYIIAIVAAIATKVSCDDTKAIPADRSQVNAWFEANVLPLSQRKGTLDAVLEAAELKARVIKVRQDGTGDFKTINQAIASIPVGNKQRVILNIGPGIYNEKILIPKTKPFIFLAGTPGAEPILQFGATAKQVGTFNSATLIVFSDYFKASFLIIKNTTPRPNADQAKSGAQAVALRLSGDKAAIYSCKIYGFQDTLLDESGRHFFKSCFIQGTIDFIFGSGKSLYLQTELHVIDEKWKTVIAAQAKQEKNEDSGFSFVHCAISGVGVSDTYLARAWMSWSDVVYSYSTISKAVLPEGWESSGKPVGNMLFGEFQNTGPGANVAGRVKFSTRLSPTAAKRYLTLGYIEASQWLLQPIS